ncbi:MAG TPA: hydroxyacid dehydrogenase, partial [Candidatus Thermoplasmatota archaeon]|nr:hydroxyacid dehydrogenase [Candidatus Thermoplasmatota archaeon]
MRILVSDPLSPEGVQALREGHDVDVRKVTPEELLRDIAGYDALVVRSETKVTRAVLVAATRIKVVGRAGVGTDNIDLEAAKARGVAVVNAPTASTNAVAELAIGHMLALLRHLQPADASVRGGRWEKKQFMGGELAGRSLGLIGVGRIGVRVTELAEAFGMEVHVYDPYVPRERAVALGVLKHDDVGALVAASDVVSVHVPLTDETRHIVDAALLARFRPGAILVNCARGGIIDEKAAADALAAG